MHQAVVEGTIQANLVELVDKAKTAVETSNVDYLNGLAMVIMATSVALAAVKGSLQSVGK